MVQTSGLGAEYNDPNNLSLQIFNGNDKRHNIVKHNLLNMSRARFIRFQPTEYHNQKALRVEVYGVLKPAGKCRTLSYTLNRLLEKNYYSSARRIYATTLNSIQHRART